MLATTPQLNMVEILVMVHSRRHENVTQINHAQLMEGGEYGEHLVHVQNHAEEASRRESVLATIPHLDMVERVVQVQARKHANVTQTNIAQLMDTLDHGEHMVNVQSHAEEVSR